MDTLCSDRVGITAGCINRLRGLSTGHLSDWQSRWGRANQPTGLRYKILHIAYSPRTARRRNKNVVKAPQTTERSMTSCRQSQATAAAILSCRNWGEMSLWRGATWTDWLNLTDPLSVGHRLKRCRSRATLQHKSIDMLTSSHIFRNKSNSRQKCLRQSTRRDVVIVKSRMTTFRHFIETRNRQHVKTNHVNLQPKLQTKNMPSTYVF